MPLPALLNGFPVNVSYKTLLYAVSVCLLLASSCNGNTSSDTSEPAKPSNDTTVREAGKNALVVQDSLYTLYIENTSGNEQLKKLLGDNDAKKMTLQFYRDNNGYLRLLAVPSDKKNKDYQLANAVQLTRSVHGDTALPATGEIYFGDLQVIDKKGKDVIKELKKHFYGSGNSAGWEYIVFVPKIESVTVGSFTKTFVTYQIMRDSEKPSFAKEYLARQPLDDAKPSPPASLE